MESRNISIVPPSCVVSNKRIMVSELKEVYVSL